MDRYLTPPEVSEILRIPVVTLYGWKHRNYGPPTISLGRLLRYPEQGLESWIASRHD
jgi:predicted DNA-binding transcriptional regulator AlpA